MIEEIKSAYNRINKRGVRTPLLTFPALNEFLGGTIYLKPENLQHTGSFKYRGAMNHIRSLAEAGKRPTIIAYSSGNHAQGVARAASEANLQATIVMPSDAPKVKINRTRAFGAKVVLYDRVNQIREEVAANLENAEKSYLIPPFDNNLTIAGQGTLGLEVTEQLDGAQLDQTLICCGGGGLATGVTAALRHAYPDVLSYLVEPEDFDDFGRSLVLGDRIRNSKLTGSICDAIITPTPGAITFPLAMKLKMQGLAVSDDEALHAVAYAAQKLRLITEPGGAVALAAALTNKIDLAGKSTLIVLSGGNIDNDLLQKALSLDLPAKWR